MLTLVSASQLACSRLSTAFRRMASMFSVKLLVLLALCVVSTANAQNITMPTVNIDGLDDDSAGDEILIILFKYVARIVLWVMMIISGYLALKRILISWNEQKANDQGRWGAVVGDAIGSIVMVIGVIALCTWLLSFLS